MVSEPRLPLTGYSRQSGLFFMLLVPSPYPHPSGRILEGRPGSCPHCVWPTKGRRHCDGEGFWVVRGGLCMLVWGLGLHSEKDGTLLSVIPNSDTSSVSTPVNLSTIVYAEFLQVLWSRAGTSSQIRQGSCGCRTSSDGRSGVHHPGKWGEARGRVVTDRHQTTQGGGECGVSHM